MRVAVFNTKTYDRLYLDALSSESNGGHQLSFIEAHLNAQTVPLAAGFEAVCCFVNDTLDELVLKALAEYGVRLIAMRCAGFNNIDLEAAKANGLTICRVPDYSPFAVAEHAAALVLDLNRHIHQAFNRVREQNYALDGLLGFDLHGKTVGLVGGGKIGGIFARIMSGFGCQVIVSDPVINPEMALVARYVTLDELWTESDIISLHCPLLASTHHLINTGTIAQMKPGVMLINTSRGALIDTPAVIAALKSGRIGYLGLDVYEEESALFFDNLSDTIIQDDVFARLTTFPNVIITGHQAFFTREALAEIARVTLQNLSDFAAGKLSETCRVTGG